MHVQPQVREQVLTCCFGHSQAIDRTNNKEGESPLRSELLRIFIKMLGALTDRDAKILVDKCKAKRQKREKAQRSGHLRKWRVFTAL